MKEAGTGLNPAWSLLLWLIPFSLLSQSLKSNPTVTSGLPKYHPAIAFMRREQYLVLVLFICWPYLRGGPNFSSFSLSCVRIILQHLTLFEPRCVVASPASLCALDSLAGVWLWIHLGREQPLPSRGTNHGGGFAPKRCGIHFGERINDVDC